MFAFSCLQGFEQPRRYCICSIKTFEYLRRFRERTNSTLNSLFSHTVFFSFSPPVALVKIGARCSNQPIILYSSMTRVPVALGLRIRRFRLSAASGIKGSVSWGLRLNKNRAEKEAKTRNLEINLSPEKKKRIKWHEETEHVTPAREGNISRQSQKIRKVKWGKKRENLSVTTSLTSSSSIP